MARGKRKLKQPKDVAAAVRAAARQEEIDEHDHIISFRSVKTRNRKKYHRASMKNVSFD